MNINKRHNKLKVRFFKTPNASCTEPISKTKRNHFFVFVFLLTLFNLNCPAQTTANQSDNIIWHSYAQFWANTQFDQTYTVALRRLKFWLKSGPSFSQHWSYKVQVLFTSLGKEKLFLQDVYGQYRNLSGVSRIRFGQFTPRYSLQRTQHDFLSSVIERATVINATIPGASLGVRDIGIQYTWNPAGKPLEIDLGIFNGSGIKNYQIHTNGYLLTHNLTYTLKREHSLWKLGYSVMYRKANHLQFRYMLPDSVFFSGNDFRCDVYALFKSTHIELQAEYLNSWLNGNHISGWYELTTIKINKKNKCYLSYDKYSDLKPSTSDNPWYIVGYNYLIKDYHLMLTLDTRFKNYNGTLKNITSLQFQMFFH